MNALITLLQENPQVSDFKINTCKKESFELFFVKGKLETLRCTDTCDRQVTVYADHGEFKGDAAFFVYPSTTEAEIREKINTAVQNALLIRNASYQLPQAETGTFQVPSNFEGKNMQDLAETISKAVFAANTQENGSLNSVEVFLNKYTDTVCNSKGLNKTQHRYDAMVEAIPTFNGDKESVELYEQYNFSSLSLEDLAREISEKMVAVKARYEAEKPDTIPGCKIVLNKLELAELFGSIAQDLNYATVYGHSNLYHKGDLIQKDRTGDPITIRMKGFAEGNIGSACFDSDGMALGEITLVADGVVENYYGSNRFGQYLGETPTGNLRCLCVEPGTFCMESLQKEAYLEVVSMSGLQVDFFNDYIGGEIRLAYYHDGKDIKPVTGVSISGKLSQVLSQMVLSREIAAHDHYSGPSRAMLPNMQIF